MPERSGPEPRVELSSRLARGRHAHRALSVGFVMQRCRARAIARTTQRLSSTSGAMQAPCGTHGPTFREDSEGGCGPASEAHASTLPLERFADAVRRGGTPVEFSESA